MRAHMLDTKSFVNFGGFMPKCQISTQASAIVRTSRVESRRGLYLCPPRRWWSSAGKGKPVPIRSKTSAVQNALVRIEANLKRVESQVVQNSDKIRIVADESMATQRHGMMEKLHNRVVGIEEMVRNALRYTSGLTVRGVPLGSPLALAVLGSVLTVAYFTRRSIYSTVAEESATLGKEVLERNARNVVATLETISRDPETLLALQALLVQLLQADATRVALVQLLLAAFEDQALCAATGSFLLASLDTPASVAELNRQAAALASATVADEQVQRDMGSSVNAALKHAATAALLPNRWIRGSSGAIPAPPVAPPTPPPPPAVANASAPAASTALSVDANASTAASAAAAAAAAAGKAATATATDAAASTDAATSGSPAVALAAGVPAGEAVEAARAMIAIDASSVAYSQLPLAPSSSSKEKGRDGDKSTFERTTAEKQADDSQKSSPGETIVVDAAVAGARGAIDAAATAAVPGNGAAAASAVLRFQLPSGAKPGDVMVVPASSDNGSSTVAVIVPPGAKAGDAISVAVASPVLPTVSSSDASRPDEERRTQQGTYKTNQGPNDKGRAAPPPPPDAPPPSTPSPTSSPPLARSDSSGTESDASSNSSDSSSSSSSITKPSRIPDSFFSVPLSWQSSVLSQQWPWAQPDSLTSPAEVKVTGPLIALKPANETSQVIVK